MKYLHTYNKFWNIFGKPLKNQLYYNDKNINLSSNWDNLFEQFDMNFKQKLNATFK